MLAEAIKAGDTVIERIVERAARLIGWAVGDVVNLLAPDVVVLGGGLVEAMPEHVRGRGRSKPPASGPPRRLPRRSRSRRLNWEMTPSSAAPPPGPRRVRDGEVGPSDHVELD